MNRVTLVIKVIVVALFLCFDIIRASISNNASSIDILILYPFFSDVNETTNLVHIVCDSYNYDMMSSHSGEGRDDKRQHRDRNRDNSDNDDDGDINGIKNFHLNFFFLLSDNNKESVDSRINHCTNYDYTIIYIDDLFYRVNNEYESESIDVMLTRIITLQNTSLVYFSDILNRYDLILMNTYLTSDENYHHHHQQQQQQQQLQHRYNHIYEFMHLLSFTSPIVMIPNDNIINLSSLSSSSYSATSSSFSSTSSSLDYLLKQSNLLICKNATLSFNKCNNKISGPRGSSDKGSGDDYYYNCRYIYHVDDNNDTIRYRSYNNKYIFYDGIIDHQHHHDYNKNDDNDNNDDDDDLRMNYLDMPLETSNSLSLLAKQSKNNSHHDKKYNFKYGHKHNNSNDEQNFYNSCNEQKEVLFGIDGLKVINKIRVINDDNDRVVVDDDDNDDDYRINNHHIRKEVNSGKKQASDKISKMKLLLCLTFTYEPNEDHIFGIVHTWGSECDGYLAYSNHTNSKLSIIKANTLKPELYDNMWFKTVLMINSIISSQLINEYQYFLFGGDDLYIIIKNLRSFLLSSKIKNKNKNNPIYIGRIIKQNQYLSYVSGGSGYILNRLSIRILADMLNLSSSPCLPTIHTSMEDVMIAHCLKLVGILPVNYDNLFDIDDDSSNSSVVNNNSIDDDNNNDESNSSNCNDDFREIVNNSNKTCTYNKSSEHYDYKEIQDNKSSFLSVDDDDGDDCNHHIYSWFDYDGKEIFHPITPSEAYKGSQEWYINRAKRYKLGDDCCSKYSISFQSIATSFTMRCLDYLIHSNGSNR